MSALTEYLDSWILLREKMEKPEGLKYSSYEELVKTEGTLWDDPDKIVRDLNGPIKNCYENSLLYALDNDLLYCEGYAYGSVIPVMHAWVLNPETGEVIETTWREPGTEYFGVALDPYEAFDLMGDYYGLLANDWMRDNQFVKEGFTMKAEVSP